jgi:hypothetical protein
MKTINGIEVTPENIIDFKPSEYIRSVLDDVQKVKALGLRIDMDSWFSNSSFSGKICTVCLGGAAVLALAKEEAIKSETIYSHGQLLQLANPGRSYLEPEDKLNSITGLFNDIRQANWRSASEEIESIWGIDSHIIGEILNPIYSNELSGKEDFGWHMRDLEERIETVAELLEEQGY